APRAPGAAPARFTPFAPKAEVAPHLVPDAAIAATAIAWDTAPESGWTRISDRFTISAPRAEVWRLLGDLPRVARAMPGAELTASDGRTLAGHLRISFGPMRARFAGTAALERDDAAMTAIVRGQGSDERGGSRAKGVVRYRLRDEVSDVAGGSATRVELALDYQLQGPLAQFARSGLVKDFAGRLIAEFARNLSASLSGAVPESAAAAAPLKIGATLVAVLWARLKRLCGL
ncbi:MAG: SRPBCC family protein, partial [Alphaproteobacteria bacterium]